MYLYREFSSQEEIDAEYNIGASLPGRERYLERYVADSTSARAELECELDVRYGPTLDEHVDIFPSAKANSPVLVFIHGGYWRALSSKEFSFLARLLVNQDVTVVVVNYSLCPAVSISEITRQNRAVIAWLDRHATEFNGDPGKIYVSGHSAGGHLTAMVCSTDWQKDYGLSPGLVKGGLAISGVFDLEPLRFSYLQPVLMINDEVLRTTNPISRITNDGPPMILSVGEKESSEFHRQATDYCERRLANKLACSTRIEEDDDHFSILYRLLDSDSGLYRALMTLMGRD